ncbi:MAG: CPBP family intramembrane glutamic endopeptidase [Elusimicrobiota bacterium]|nr:CPBP family intramembrane glutamic endopeptidase [Elusimicrobiota bacterium]
MSKNIKRLSFFAAKIESSNIYYFGILFLICLFVLGLTFYCINLHLTGFNFLVSQGMEKHTASFLAHLLQVLIYNTVLISCTASGMKIFGISLSEIGWKKPDNFKKIILSVAIMTIYIFAWGIFLSLYKTGTFHYYIVTLNKNWADLGNPSVYIFLFTAVFNAPIEEVFYRGFLQTAIEKKLGAKYAIFFTSIIYALSHMRVSKNLTQKFISGLILGSLKNWGTTLWNPIAGHLTKNIIASWFSIRYF